VLIPSFFIDGAYTDSIYVEIDENFCDLICPLNWSEVFNSSLKSWGSINNAEQASINAGYKYYVWNGWVYNNQTKKKSL